MSSDSELDEFYDAEDVTPARSDSSGIRRIKKDQEPTSPCVVPEEKKPSIDSANPQLPLNIEEEEKKLLREKAEAEERRKQEDAEYKKKLEELQERRRMELLREKEKEEAALKAQEARDRMRRLEHMRGAMSGVKSPVHPATKPPHADGTTDEAASDEAAQQVVDEVCAEMCGFSLNTSTDLNSSHDFRHPSASSASSSSSRPPLDLPVSSVSQPISDKNNLNNPSAVDEKLVSKNFPELLHGKAGDTPSSRSSPGRDSSSQESSTGGQEPDLIQSTKNKPPAEVPSPHQPVAPPRRRKKKKGPIPALSTPPIPEDQQASTPRPRGLPVTPTSPEVRVSLMVDNLEQSLDLHSATCGIRHVTAEEEEATRGEGQVESDTISVASTETMESGWSMEITKDNNVSTERTKDKSLSPHTNPEQKLQVHPSIIEAALENEKPQKNILKARLILRKSSSLDRMKAESFKREKIIKSNSLSRDSKLAGEDEIPVKFQRPRSNSGRYLSDKEILDQVSVLNLDTGEKVPLSLAEERLPQGVNPLTLHIMRRTKEYSSDSSLHNQPEKKKVHSQNEETSRTLRTFKTKKKSTKLKKLFSKIKTKTDGRHEVSSSDDDESADGRRMIKIKASNNHKGPYDFDLLVPVQDLSSHSAQSAAVWTMKFSHCGKLLATGGQDNALRIWVLKDAYAYFDDMRQKYSEATRVSPAPSQDSLNSVSSETSSLSSMGGPTDTQTETHPTHDDDDEHAPFMKKPFHVYRSHTADLLDLSWSKNYFILSSSMDKTVRLWHISRKECLCCFQHIDFVTAIAFHPRDDRYFLSGSLDGKLRLWNIPEKKVALWNEVNNKTLITAANFCRNGQFAVVGTYDGRCIFYYAEQLKYFTQIHVRSTRGKNARGRKVTGVEQVPGSDQILVTSNDSRIRLYDLRDLTLACKYRGYANNSSQIKASFSSNGKYIISGSEDHFVYIWRTKHLSKTARKDRSDFWEGIRAHSAVVTAAIFAPNPGVIIKPQFEFMDADTKDEETTDVRGEVIVSADFGGAIKVFINKFKPGSG